MLACSGSSSQSMDGEYHQFYIASNTEELSVSDEGYKVVIKDGLVDGYVFDR